MTEVPQVLGAELGTPQPQSVPSQPHRKKAAPAVVKLDRLSWEETILEDIFRVTVRVSVASM